MVYSNFLSLLKFMKSSLEIPHPIQVRRIKMPKGYDGDCRLKNDLFIIRIDKNLPENHAIDVLLHELGHSLSWDKENNIHGAIWGKSYSFVYRKFLEWSESKTQ